MNIKDVKLAPMSYWVKSDKPTEYHDDNGTYYELWGDTLAVVATEEGELELTNVNGSKKMTDVNTRIKNRIHATHDLHTLWQKLRNEGWQVWEDEDYTDNEQAPWHLYCIDKGNAKQGASIEVLFRDKTEREIAEDKELGLTPFRQEIEWVRY